MNETLTIIPSDGTILVDGTGLINIDQKYLTWIPDDIHAFHWFVSRNQGEIEFNHHMLDSSKKPNERVTELGIFEQAITILEEESERRHQMEVEEIAAWEASRDYWAELRSSRDYKLLICDWTQLPNAPLTEQQKQSWENYRQELRDLPETITDPKPLILDENHPSWPIPPN
jgi:hypothetical protein